MLRHKCWPTFKSVLSYLLSDITKKTRSFQIGIFTIFLVVSFLAMLQSAVDVAPITFVKIGTDQGGQEDFQILPTKEIVIDGNFNY